MTDGSIQSLTPQRPRCIKSSSTPEALLSKLGLLCLIVATASSMSESASRLMRASERCGRGTLVKSSLELAVIEYDILYDFMWFRDTPVSAILPYFWLI
ncbi:MAG: hypothetical protein Tsb009_30820 [Planctomycetaceae bacterium]